MLGKRFPTVLYPSFRNDKLALTSLFRFAKYDILSSQQAGNLENASKHISQFPRSYRTDAKDL
jgi:hypothetical protein